MNSIVETPDAAKSGIPSVVSCSEMAETIGISPRRLRQLVDEGRVEGRITRDRYDFRRVITTYLAFCRGQG